MGPDVITKTLEWRNLMSLKCFRKLFLSTALLLAFSNVLAFGQRFESVRTIDMQTFQVAFPPVAFTSISDLNQYHHYQDLHIQDPHIAQPATIDNHHETVLRTPHRLQVYREPVRVMDTGRAPR